jgi:hypothetical protein
MRNWCSAVNRYADADDAEYIAAKARFFDRLADAQRPLRVGDRSASDS